MKTFNAVYDRSKVSVMAERDAKASSDHAMLIESIKKQYAINDFNQLSESEKSSFRAMVHSMWNATSGLNEAGVRFINEGKATLTMESTPEQVEVFVKREMKRAMPDCILAIAEGRTCPGMKDLKDSVEEMTGKKIAMKDFKEWMYECAIKAVADGVKKFKL